MSRRKQKSFITCAQRPPQIKMGPKERTKVCSFYTFVDRGNTCVRNWQDKGSRCLQALISKEVQVDFRVVGEKDSNKARFYCFLGCNVPISGGRDASCLSGRGGCFLFFSLFFGGGGIFMWEICFPPSRARGGSESPCTGCFPCSFKARHYACHRGTFWAARPGLPSPRIYYFGLSAQLLKAIGTVRDRPMNTHEQSCVNVCSYFCRTHNWVWDGGSRSKHAFT